MEFLLTESALALVFSVTSPDGGGQATCALPSPLESEDSPVRSEANGLRASQQSFVEQARHIAQTYTPAARVGHLRELAAKTLGPSTKALIGAGQAEVRARDAASSRLTAVPPADSTTAALRKLDRGAFSELDDANAFAWIEQADVEQLGAIMEAGRSRYPHRPSQLMDRIEERYSALNFIRFAGTAENFVRQPSCDEPLALGVDWKAAERSAAAGLARHRNRQVIVEGVEQTLRGLAGVVALACGLSQAEAFDLLTRDQSPA